MPASARRAISTREDSTLGNARSPPAPRRRTRHRRRRDRRSHHRRGGMHRLTMSLNSLPRGCCNRRGVGPCRGRRRRRRGRDRIQRRLRRFHSRRPSSWAGAAVGI